METNVLADSAEKEIADDQRMTAIFKTLDCGSAKYTGGPTEQRYSSSFVPYLSPRMPCFRKEELVSK
jgi:hypothetical protein